MSIKDRVRPAYKNLRISLAGRPGSRRKTAVIYGNCQAEALLQVLNQRPAFGENYRIVSIPPVHLLQSSDLARVRSLIRRTDLFITQKVRDNYRNLPIGSNQMSASLPASAEVVRIPSMFFAGLHPYHAYVHATGELGTSLPLTDAYHDLRHLYAASRNLSDDDAVAWLNGFQGNSAVIRGLAELGVENLRNREADLDVSVSDSLTTVSWNSFHTLNHPSNAVLGHVASGIENRVAGTNSGASYAGAEILGFLRAPVEPDVANALGVVVPAGFGGWTIHGTTVSASDVARKHLAWYRANPKVVEAGIGEHRDRMQQLGMSL
jgi:hypothetical protein